MPTKYRLLLLPKEYTCNSNNIVLNKKHSHYLINVLRLKKGEKLTVYFEDLATAYVAIINRAIPLATELTLIEPLPLKKTMDHDICIIFSLCKNKANDLVCEKCTEIGVSKIIFYVAKRSLSIFGTKTKQQTAIKKKLERFNKIATNAARQCHSFNMPKLFLTNSLNELSNLISPYKKKILLSLESNAPLIYSCLNKDISSYTIFVGPEGGFTQEEEDTFTKELLFSKASLGDNILKAETAAISSAAICKTFLNSN